MAIDRSEPRIRRAGVIWITRSARGLLTMRKCKGWIGCGNASALIYELARAGLIEAWVSPDFAAFASPLRALDSLSPGPTCSKTSRETEAWQNGSS